MSIYLISTWKKCDSYDNIFSSINNINFINFFNLANDKIISQVFRKKQKYAIYFQSKEIIENTKAYTCCEFNFELDECDMPKTSVTTSMKESNLINPESTLNIIFIEKNEIFS